MRLAIGGLGLATALGTSAVEACAAARAGLSRTSEAELDVPVVAHVLSGVTDGFTGVGRLSRLATLALDDLMQGSGLTPAALASGALVLHVRDDFHERANEALDAAEPELTTSPEARSEHARLRERLLMPLAKHVGIPGSRAHLLQGGPAAFVAAVEQASALLARGEARQCIVGSVDAPADPAVQSLWASLGMLKAPDNPVGVFAGEGAAFLLLQAEGPRAARAPQAWLEGWCAGEAGPHRFSLDKPTGRGFFTAMRESFAAANRPVDARVAIFNHGGDEYRGRELAMALTLLGMAGMPRDFEAWFPATSFGDTGSASTAIGIVMAVRAFARGYARGRDIAVMAQSDDGASGCCIVSAASNG